MVVGSKAEAAAQRERAQHGAAATGRRRQAVQLKRAHNKAEAKSKEEKAISKEVKHTMKQHLCARAWRACADFSQPRTR